ncbi:IS66 family transposase, partial [Undibacterium crateris]|uniref:IS66 family transposase n=1 Tax=Undibacterium crateris TaxID=2528175 RepID=UPI00138A2E26
HARRKFHELWADHSSQIVGEVLDLFGRLYEVEREEASLGCKWRHLLRKQQASPVLEVMYRWLQTQDQRVPRGSATARAIGYSLNPWQALTYYLNDPAVPIESNWIENTIRPIALGRKNWMFAGSLRASKRAAAIVSLIHSTRINGHAPYAYLRDVLERLPLQPYSRIGELLPHRWSAGYSFPSLLKRPVKV